jgi:polar amino acid transport system permease protein
MDFDWRLATSILPDLARGALVTIEATAIAFVLSLIGGIVLLAMRRVKSGTVAAATVHLVDFVRSTPLLVQMFFLYFLGPEIGIALTPLQTGIVAMAIHYSCYVSEIYRAGIESVPAAQWEAAVALNFRRDQVYRAVIVPQVLPLAIPSVGNLLIFMFKDSPLLAAISVSEMMLTASKVGAERFQYLEPVTMCGVLFLTISLVSAVVIRWLESRMGRVWR